MLSSDLEITLFTLIPAWLQYATHPLPISVHQRNRRLDIRMLASESRITLLSLIVRVKFQRALLWLWPQLTCALQTICGHPQRSLRTFLPPTLRPLVRFPVLNARWWYVDGNVFVSHQHTHKIISIKHWHLSAVDADEAEQTRCLCGRIEWRTRS